MKYNTEQCKHSSNQSHKIKIAHTLRERDRSLTMDSNANKESSVPIDHILQGINCKKIRHPQPFVKYIDKAVSLSPRQSAYKSLH